MTEPTNKDDLGGFWNRFGVLLLERFTSPLISTFVISWCVTNYKVLLIVFGKGDLDDKLGKLDSYFAGTAFTFPASWWIYGIPLGMTAFYIFLYPHINLWVMEIVNKNDNKLKTQQELNQYKKVVDTMKATKIEDDAKLAEIRGQAHELALEKESIKQQSLSKDLEIVKLTGEVIRYKNALNEFNQRTLNEQKLLELIFSAHPTDEEVSLSDLSIAAEKDKLKVDSVTDALGGLYLKDMIRINLNTEEMFISITPRGLIAVTNHPDSQLEIENLARTHLSAVPDTDNHAENIKDLGIRIDPHGP